MHKYLLIDSNTSCVKNDSSFNFTLASPFDSNNLPRECILRNISFSSNNRKFHPYFYVDIDCIGSYLKTTNCMAHTYVVYPDISDSTYFKCDMSAPTNKSCMQNFDITFKDSNHNPIDYKYNFSILFELVY